MTLDDPSAVAEYERAAIAAVSTVLHDVLPVAFRSLAKPDMLEIAAGKMLQRLADKGWHLATTANLRQLEGMAQQLGDCRARLERLKRGDT